MKVIRQKQSLPYRELQRLCTASRAGTAVWERPIARLKHDGHIAGLSILKHHESGHKRGDTLKLLNLKKISRLTLLTHCWHIAQTLLCAITTINCNELVVISEQTQPMLLFFPFTDGLFFH